MNDPVAMKLLSKAGEMPSLNPPDDESIKTLYVGGLDARVSEQDLRDNFYVHGEIESIRMVLQRACAFVTYTTREAAERAAEELSNKLVIKGVRLKLMWGRPQAPKPEGEMQDDDDTRQGAVFHAGMLPRSVISEQQSNQQPLPPGTENHTQLPLNYFNIPAPPQAARAFYPSMDPQRMGVVIPSQREVITRVDQRSNRSSNCQTIRGTIIPWLLRIRRGSFHRITHHMGTWRRHHLTSNSSMPLTYQWWCHILQRRHRHLQGISILKAHLDHRSLKSSEKLQPYHIMKVWVP